MIVALILIVLMQTFTPPDTYCIDPEEETLILYYPDVPICQNHEAAKRNQ